MTSDSAQFVARERLEAAGYRAGADACWRLPAGAPEYLPLYQGAMVYDLHPNAAGHDGGAGHRTRWAPLPLDAELPQPQFLIDAERWRTRRGSRAPARLVLRALSNASNERTLVPCLLPDVPCGNSLVVLTPPASDPMPLRSCAIATGVLGSLVCDWAVRQQLAGTNLNRFVLEELVGPRLSAAAGNAIAVLVLRLCAVLPWQESLWQLAGDEGWLPDGVSFAQDAARLLAVRRQLRVELDVAVARAFGLDGEDLAWILRDCDRSAAALRVGRQQRVLDPKGFWRLDQQLPPQQRHTLRVLAAVQGDAREVVRSAPACS